MNETDRAYVKTVLYTLEPIGELLSRDIIHHNLSRPELGLIISGLENAVKITSKSSIGTATMADALALVRDLIVGHLQKGTLSDRTLRAAYGVIQAMIEASKYQMTIHVDAVTPADLLLH